jgi:acyl carrier protein
MIVSSDGRGAGRAGPGPRHKLPNLCAALLASGGEHVGVLAGDQAPLPVLLGHDVERGARVSDRLPVEATIAQIWADVLGFDQVDVDDSFFDLGGNSLVAVQLIAQIRKAVGVRLSMRALFDSPTVGGMAKQVEQLRADGAVEASPPSIPRLARQKG